MTRFWTVIGCELIAPLALATAQNPAPPASPSQPAPLPAITAPTTFTLELKKTIAIIYTKCKDDPLVYEGTGFFVSKADARLPVGLSFGYLVTNRHVVQPHIETGVPCTVADQQIRINTVAPDPSTGARNFFITGRFPWTYPADDNVDLAVFPFAPDPQKFDVRAFPVEEFATTEVIHKQNIVEGDQVMYAGYFYQFPGSLHTEPIVRQGIIAMIPDEPIVTTLGRPGKGYLADAHVFGGNSGSPMFVNVGGARNGTFMAGYHYLFLGVVSGLEKEDDDNAVHPVVTYDGKVSGNSGISFIIPADQVADLINGPGMTATREETIRQLPPPKVAATK